MAVYIEGCVPVTDNAADITDRLQRDIFASWYVAVPVFRRCAHIYEHCAGYGFTLLNQMIDIFLSEKFKSPMTVLLIY